MLTYARMADGITIYILGDYGPFSRMGKSIGYQITIGQSRFLIDCGAPLFQQIGGHGLKGIKGLIITHCHDDHKRWFSDLTLFNMYALDISSRVCLLTSEDVHDELIKASGPALERSLSEDSKRIVDIPYENYIDYRVLGPRARYRIVAKDEGNGKTSLGIADRNGAPVGPERAKIVINGQTKRPRMLFKDPQYGEWIEPESFYPFSSTVFYEENRNTHVEEKEFTIDAIKAPVWHGIPGIGVVVRTREETLIFSSDTAHNTELWKQLSGKKRVQRLATSKEEFESSSILIGDINDYVERIWSEERYREAVKAFNNAVVVHDISVGNSVVHTNYENLDKTSLKKDRVMLTHGPDKMTSEWILCRAEKTFKVKGDKFFEVVGDRLYPMNADVYHKEAGGYYVGYKNRNGRYAVYEKAGRLSISSEERFDPSAAGKLLYHVDLYEDISGRYFPKREDRDTMYLERKDGKVELVEFTDKGSRGSVVEDQRDRLS
jgi:ribonuclease BN (tRNA processing enzyme)